MRRTSRYLRLRAEQVIITPEGGVAVVVLGVGVVVVVVERVVGLVVRVRRACSRSRMSQSQRSASVRGWPLAIFWTFSGVWNWGLVNLCSLQWQSGRDSLQCLLPGTVSVAADVGTRPPTSCHILPALL